MAAAAPKLASKVAAKPAAKATAAAKPVAAKPVASKAAAAPKTATKAAAKTELKAATAKPAVQIEAKPKLKLVRDSFTMPRADFELITRLKDRAIGFKRSTKKSELLRAGLQALMALTDKQLAAILTALTPIKTGRPKKSD
ncbi:hypothetical protein [Roseateles albus]|uniref:Uncharacterized protein n=1 Tax=Roseateles albus TaxID=2987525 RepID=A0ABT5KB51_9BURK|nr:hypothetical protein [Roseateles albus]MDC8771098.1 hypothetical protein [Roseateles albus]